MLVEQLQNRTFRQAVVLGNRITGGAGAVGGHQFSDRVGGEPSPKLVRPARRSSFRLSFEMKGQLTLEIENAMEPIQEV